MSITDPSLDYRKLTSDHGTYRESRLVQNTGATSVQLSTSSTSESVFDLPSKCMNLSKSHLSFDIKLPDLDTKYKIFHTIAAAWCDRIELKTRGGTQIVDVNNANMYYRATAPYTKKLVDMLDADTVKVVRGQTNDDIYTSMNSMVCRNNQAVPSASLTAGANAGARIDGTRFVINRLGLTEPEYVVASTVNVATTSPVTASWLHVDIPLSEFKGTFLAAPTDCYFPEVVQLRIQWARLNQIAVNVDDVAGGARTFTTLPSGGTIENLYLYQALEVDPSICNALIEKTRTGMTQLIPFVHTYREQYGPNASSYNRQLKFNSSHGRSLLRVIHCNSQAEQDETFGQITNEFEATGIGGKVVSSFYTSMDNLRQQEIDIRSAKGEDYAMMASLLKDSAVQSRSVYNYNRIFCDSYDGQPLAHTSEMDSVENGLPLGGVERLWSVSQTLNGLQSGVVYVFAVAQKTLSISQGQILVS